MQEVPVLIVGGGPVGLTASILLSRLRVRSLLAERHPGTAIHPKARGINARTMEIFRQCGVENAIRNAGLPPERTGLIVWVRTLAGEEIERRVPSRSSVASAALSPARNCVCAQDDLEPVLRAHAEALGIGTLSFNAEVVTCEQDETGVTAEIVDRRNGSQTRVRAQYVIAADGAQSRLRRQLGVPMIGQEHVYESVNILFEADLRPWTVNRPAALYFVEHPSIRATFLTINGVDRWGFLVNNLTAYGYDIEEFTQQRSADLISTLKCLVSCPGLLRPRSPLGIAMAVSSLRGTPPMKCRLLAASASTPGFKIFTTLPGSCQPCSQVRRRTSCSIRIMTNAIRSGDSSRNRASSIHCQWDASAGAHRGPSRPAPNISTSRA